MVFITDSGCGLGHAGFVEAVDGGFLHPIEGNTVASRSRVRGGS